MLPAFLSRCAANPGFSLLPPSQKKKKRQAWCHYPLFFLTTLPIIMFTKTALTSLVLGALYVNALAIPVAREPAPDPCEFPRSFPRHFYISQSNFGLLQRPKMPKSLTTCSREHSLQNPGANQIPLRSSWHFRERSRVESSPTLDASKIHRYPPNPSKPLNVKPPIGRYFEPRPVRNRWSTSNDSST